MDRQEAALELAPQGRMPRVGSCPHSARGSTSRQPAGTMLGAQRRAGWLSRGKTAWTVGSVRKRGSAVVSGMVRRGDAAAVSVGIPHTVT